MSMGEEIIFIRNLNAKLALQTNVRFLVIYHLKCSIFVDNPAREQYIHMLSACDERSPSVVKATAKVLIDTAPEK